MNRTSQVAQKKAMDIYKKNRVKQINKSLQKFLNQSGPSFLEIKINQGSIKDLKRPKNFLSIKRNFIKSF